ncbi:hypothetical protein ACFX1W_017194 [Malus domestica]
MWNDDDALYLVIHKSACREKRGKVTVCVAGGVILLLRWIDRGGWDLRRIVAVGLEGASVQQKACSVQRAVHVQLNRVTIKLPLRIFQSAVVWPA